MSGEFAADGAWTLDLVRQAEAAGAQLKFVAFWSQKPATAGALGPHVLSQWYEHPFTVEGRVFATAEHMMMFEKARLFGDGDIAEHILAASSAGEAKDLGRRVRGFDEFAWEQHRFEIVSRTSGAKFGACTILRDFLVGTGYRILVEASPQDRIWGIGAERSSGLVERPGAWAGLNLLGFALMQARARLSRLPAPLGHCRSCEASFGNREG